MNYNKKWYQEHKEQHRLNCEKWRDKNRGRIRAKCREYNQIHKEEISERQKEKRKKFREQHPFANWPLIRKKVLERDNYTCQLCGIEANEVHHKDGSGSNVLHKEMNNNMNNLVILCRKCHAQEDLKLCGNTFSKGKWEEETERNAEILELAKKISAAEIGRMFGITRQRVYQLINK